LQGLKELVHVGKLLLSHDFNSGLVFHLLLIQNELLLFFVLWHWEWFLVLRKTNPKASVFSIAIGKVGLHVVRLFLLFLD